MDAPIILSSTQIAILFTIESSTSQIGCQPSKKVVTLIKNPFLYAAIFFYKHKHENCQMQVLNKMVAIFNNLIVNYLTFLNQVFKKGKNTSTSSSSKKF